jgi:hypothetical protein
MTEMTMSRTAEVAGYYSPSTPPWPRPCGTWMQLQHPGRYPAHPTGFGAGRRPSIRIPEGGDPTLILAINWKTPCLGIQQCVRHLLQQAQRQDQRLHGHSQQFVPCKSGEGRPQ